MSAETLERAITIHQPYAWAVAAGHKPVENRTWRPPLEMVGKLICIHASARPHSDFGTTLLTWDRARVGIPRQEDGEWVAGALIGVARLVGVVRHNNRTGRLHWLARQGGCGRDRHSGGGGIVPSMGPPIRRVLGFGERRYCSRSQFP